MKSGSKKAEIVGKITRYIGNRVAGENKQDSAIKAGYSETTARIPSLIEHTKTYQSIVERVLTNNANVMLALSTSLYNDIEKGLLDELKPMEKGQLHKLITDSNDKLIPKVTLKESTDKNGVVTRTAWAQNATQVQEALTPEE